MDLRTRRHGTALRQGLPQLQQVGRGLLDVDVDRVEAGDRCQRIRLVCRDQRAFGDARQPDAPANRGRDASEAHVDLRCPKSRAVLRDRGIGLPRLCKGVGIILLGDRLHLGERLVALGAGPRRDGASPGALQVGGGLRLLGRVNARVDLVERLALAHDRAFAEQSALDDSRDLRPDIGDLIGSDPSGQFLLQWGASHLDDDEADLSRAALPAAT